jgi:hypothetical protein
LAEYYYYYGDVLLCIIEATGDVFGGGAKEGDQEDQENIGTYCVASIKHLLEREIICFLMDDDGCSRTSSWWCCRHRRTGRYVVASSIR